MKLQSGVLITVACLASSAYGALIPDPPFTDTDRRFRYFWDWDNPRGNEVGIATLTNWFLGVRIEDEGVDWRVTWRVQHLVNPDAGEMLPDTIELIVTFPKANRPFFVKSS
jgi:hypothetical protein